MAASATIPAPLAFASWLAANGDKLQPPVNNFCLYSGTDFVLMVVGGPNQRNDFHVNETEEWFYQLKGKMLLRIVENDAFRDVYIEEGEMFMLPGNTPHSPIRFADTTGLVMERVRPADATDRLRWYCSKGKHEKPTMIREETFHCEDLGKQLVPLIDHWMKDEESRRCGVCGLVEDPRGFQRGIYCVAGGQRKHDYGFVEKDP